MDAVVADAADDKGLAAARSHPRSPFRLVLPPLGVEVFEGPNMVHLNLFPRTAEFAGVGQEPLNEL